MTLVDRLFPLRRTARVARRLRQSRPPRPPELCRPLESSEGRPPSPPRSPAVSPPRVRRRPPSPPGSPSFPASVACHPRQSRPPSRPPSPPESSAVPARSSTKSSPAWSFAPESSAMLFLEKSASVVRRPGQSRPPSPPGSLAKLFVARPVPTRVLALGDKGTQFYYCAPWLAVPNQVWQTRSAWQSKQISKRGLSFRV